MLVYRLEHIEFPAKLLDYFLRINKSNINQLVLGFTVLTEDMSVLPLETTPGIKGKLVVSTVESFLFPLL